MVDINSIEIVTEAPAPIRRNTGTSSELAKAMVSLKPGTAMRVTTDTDKEHKAVQRNINVIMKKLKDSHPHAVFVTRTISINEDEAILGVYRIEDKAA
jgi:hypothetical protein